MAFKLNSVVPWGRNMDEYKKMFLLGEDDKNKRIAGFGDGPASFNCEATKKGFNVVSYDPIYQFSKSDIADRIEEVGEIVMKQMAENMENYVWKNIKSLTELEDIRMSAMKVFIDDYDIGKTEGRYVYHELPNRLEVPDNTYDIGLSSHFLLMYKELGFDFHIKAISEMLRACKEVRIFPIVDLDANESKLTADVIDYFKDKYDINIVDTKYEFQKCANKLMIIRKK